MSLALTLSVVAYLLWTDEIEIKVPDTDPASLEAVLPCGNPDSAALMALFNATNGPGWSVKTNWGDTCDICMWYGVSCNGTGRVIALDLPVNVLSGDLPAQIGDLSFLEKIDFAYNQLSGNIPDEITQLPLIILDLRSNQFAGSLSPSISNLEPTLEEFYITNNGFTGALPPEIGSLSSLRVLTMENNEFNAIPTEIGNLVNLEIWYCGGMTITSVPPSIGNLVNLEQLYLSFNEITAIPAELGNLTNIEEIYIEYNQLSGSIPSTLGNLSNLKALALEGNLLSGQIPSGISNNLGLNYLFLGSNNLSGPLPAEFGLLANLRVLEVWDNNLEGCIPSSYSSLCAVPNSFYYGGNPCLWQGPFTDFCNGADCTFGDYTLTTSESEICVGASTTITTTGGHSFSWSTGESTSSIVVAPLIDTWYHLTLTTSGGCNRKDSIQIMVHHPPLAIATGNDVTSAGGNDGTATASATNGQPPYSFQWSTGEVTPQIMDLAAGAYFVTVTDYRGCQDSASVLINEPSCPPAGTQCDDGNPNTYQDQEDGACSCAGTLCPTLLLHLVFTNNTCYGESDATAVVNPDQGSPPYLIQWSTGETGFSIINLPTGPYSVTVTDANGCRSTEAFTVVQPPEIVATFDISNESGPGANDGAIDLHVSGGSGNFSFQWSNGGTTEDLSGLPGGIYSVTISDAVNCQVVGHATVETICLPVGSACDDGDMDTYNDHEDGACNCAGIPCPVIATNISSIDVSCLGAEDGSAGVTPSGGTLPYQIYWSTGDSTLDLQNIGPGHYSVTVTDFNGCFVTSSVSLKLPAALEIGLAGLEESAPGAADGAIIATVTGGAFPYNYLWSNGASTKDIKDLTGDNKLYALTVTDVHGCTISDSLRLQTGCSEVGTACDDGDPETYNDQEDGQCSCKGKPCDLIVLNEVITPIHCGQKDNGSVSLTPTGGFQPYSYLWSNGSTDSINNMLSNKIYVVTVTDHFGCQVVGHFQISESPILHLEAEIVNESTDMTDDASINLTVIGGKSPYSFHWSNGATTEDINGLSGDSANYKVIVTDGFGCQDSLEVIVNSHCIGSGNSCDDGDPNTFDDKIDNNCNCVGIPCDTISDIDLTIQNVRCFGLADGAAKLDTTGLNLSSFSWSTGSNKLIIK